MKKFDTHVHCGIYPADAAEKPYYDAEGMLRHLDTIGVEKAVIMSSGETPRMPGADATNAACARMAADHPDRLAWMCNLDPVDPDTVYDRLAKCKADGAVGIGELMINRWIDDPFLWAVFAAAEKLDLPVTFHMSPEPGYSYGICDKPGLPLLEKALQAFPNLKFVGHSQVFWLEISADCPKEGNKERSGYGEGPVIPGRVEELMRRYPNLYGDLSAGSASRALMRDEAYGLRFLEMFGDRLFFATDTVNAKTLFPLSDWLDACAADGRLSEKTYEAVCKGNAKRVYNL